MTGKDAQTSTCLSSPVHMCHVEENNYQLHFSLSKDSFYCLLEHTPHCNCAVLRSRGEQTRSRAPGFRIFKWRCEVDCIYFVSVMPKIMQGRRLVSTNSDDIAKWKMLLSSTIPSTAPYNCERLHSLRVINSEAVIPMSWYNDSAIAAVPDTRGAYGLRWHRNLVKCKTYEISYSN